MDWNRIFEKRRAEMSNTFIFLSMVFLHVVDDFYLQGILAKMKQKQWWSENAPESLYRNDYIIALIIHGLSWSFLVMLPIAADRWFNVGMPFAVAFLLNAIVHAIVDNAKCNKHKINLIVDQGTHFLQILITYAVFVFA